MSFDFSTLITDRNVSDLDTLNALVQKPMSMWTAEELTAFNAAAMKGSYNYTDLNRVTACMEYLDQKLAEAGYVSGYQKIKIPHKRDGLDPYVWYEDDVPTESQMQTYINNVEGIRAALNVAVVAPTDMAGLTIAEANAIEQILAEIAPILERIRRVSIHSGTPWAISGNTAFYFQN